MLLSFTGVAALKIRPKQLRLQKESESSYMKSALDWLICHSMHDARDTDITVVWRLLVIALISYVNKCHVNILSVSYNC